VCVARDMVGAMRETFIEGVLCLFSGFAFALGLEAMAWITGESLPRHATWLAIMIGVVFMSCQVAARIK
jgi:hypothetical protein